MTTLQVKHLVEHPLFDRLQNADMNPQTKRLYAAALAARGIHRQADVAKALNISNQTLSNWEKRGPSKAGMIAAEHAFGCRPAWIETGSGNMHTETPINSPDLTAFANAAALNGARPLSQVRSYEIPVKSSPGNCEGKGKIPEEALPIFKTQAWFEGKSIDPFKCAVIQAHGHSMADYIIEGDLVIVDLQATNPVSGEIFLLKTPEGERFKMLRRNMDGSWDISCKNPDKRTYPDERVSSDVMESIEIVGKAVYRQSN